jgi:hypothetical protein
MVSNYSSALSDLNEERSEGGYESKRNHSTYNSRESYTYGNEGNIYDEDIYRTGSQDNFTPRGESKEKEEQHKSSYSPYTSFNYESRVADYQPKKATEVLHMTHNTGNNFVSNISDIGSNNIQLKYSPKKAATPVYVAPKKQTEYTKDEYPSNHSDQNDSMYGKPNNANNNYTPEFCSNQDYEYESHVKERNNNLLNSPSNYEYSEQGVYEHPEQKEKDNSHVYDSEVDYFSRDIDPK